MGNVTVTLGFLYLGLFLYLWLLLLSVAFLLHWYRVARMLPDPQEPQSRLTKALRNILFREWRSPASSPGRGPPSPGPTRGGQSEVGGLGT